MLHGRATLHNIAPIKDCKSFAERVGGLGSELPHRHAERG